MGNNFSLKIVSKGFIKFLMKISDFFVFFAHNFGACLKISKELFPSKLRLDNTGF